MFARLANTTFATLVKQSKHGFSTSFNISNRKFDFINQFNEPTHDFLFVYHFCFVNSFCFAFLFFVSFRSDSIRSLIHLNAYIYLFYYIFRFSFLIMFFFLILHLFSCHLLGFRSTINQPTNQPFKWNANHHAVFFSGRESWRVR